MPHVDDWKCVLVLEFTEGAPERRDLHHGTKEACECRAATYENAIHRAGGVPYDGERTPSHAFLVVAPDVDEGEPAEAPGEASAAASSI